jgi:hypothetical protein
MKAAILFRHHCSAPMSHSMSQKSARHRVLILISAPHISSRFKVRDLLAWAGPKVHILGLFHWIRKHFRFCWTVEVVYHVFDHYVKRSNWVDVDELKRDKMQSNWREWICRIQKKLDSDWTKQKGMNWNRMESNGMVCCGTKLNWRERTKTKRNEIEWNRINVN